MEEKTTEKKRICFIVNPVSGRKKNNKNIDELIDSVLDSKEYSISIQYTKSVGHAGQLCREAIKAHTEFIVAVGGDGTINEVASEMIHSDSVLGIIPSGSGNGLARHLGIPFNIKKAIQLIKKAEVTRIDTATIHNRRFISIAGVGFDALIAKEFAKNKRRGFVTYLKLVTDKFINYRPKKYKLSFPDGSKRIIRAFFIAFANSNQFGYNTQISPNALLNDGKLDICIVKKPRLIDMPGILNLLLLKKIEKSPFVEVIKSEGVVVKRMKNRVINIDGEAIKVKKNFEVKIDPLSLKVLVNKNEQKR